MFKYLLNDSTFILICSIVDSLGEEFAEGVILDLEATWQESDIRTPLVCFLSMGSDPTNMIEQLAKKHKIECRSISMGQGQEVHARRLMQQSMTNVSICTHHPRGMATLIGACQ